MNRINVESLNEIFNIDGPSWIECDPSTWDDGAPCHPPSAFEKGHQTNKGRPTSLLQKEIARKNAIERNKKYKGANNPRAKTWRIVYDDGREIIVQALQRWAIENGYSASGIKNIAYGKWKTYKDLVTVEEVAHAH